MILKRHRLQFWVGFHFLCHIFNLFPFYCSFYFPMFHYCFFFNIFFFLLVCFFLCIFLLNSFYYLKVFITGHPEALEFFFLIVCFLMKVGTSIKSSKEKLLPILKKLFIYRSRLCTSSLFFFTLLIFILFPFHYSSFSTFHHALNQQLSYFRTKVL